MHALFIAGCIVVGLEALLLLIWIGSIFFVQNGTDPAGQGMAMGFIIALAIYIIIGLLLVLHRESWSMILALVMGLLPMTIVLIGLIKNANKKEL